MIGKHSPIYYYDIDSNGDQIPPRLIETEKQREQRRAITKDREQRLAYKRFMREKPRRTGK